MSPEHWHCWLITGCRKQDTCHAGQQLDKECWQIVQEMDDFRSAMSVCEDCIVYVSKAKKSVLSEAEIAEIMEKKGFCVLASKCTDKVMATSAACALTDHSDKKA
mgnify:FL=1